MNKQTLLGITRSPDLRNKILITLGIITLYRVGSFIPTPGVDYTSIQTCIDSTQDNSVYAAINLFSGGALLQLSIFALGVMPYITASIIIQLLTVVIPRLAYLKKEGKSGEGKLTQYTRYLTVGLALLQATAILSLARTPGALFTGCPEQLIPNQNPIMLVLMVLTMTAGTILVMWMGEQITERGVGNGMSLLIFASIVATIPSQFGSVMASKGAFLLLATIAVSLLILVIVTFVEQSQRRIPLHYARQSGGTTRLMSTANTYLPIKVNMAGVIPVIFASSLLFVPALLVQLSQSQAGWAQWISTYLSTGNTLIYLGIFATLIIFFAFFYVSITFNPDEIADNLKQSGGFIPGIRAGKSTSEYLSYVINRLQAAGAVYLGAIAVLPVLILNGMGVSDMFVFGGVSILIAVGVGLDTMKQVNAQVEQRSYSGFLK